MTRLSTLFVKCSLCVVLLTSSTSLAQDTVSSTPLPQAHAHNDYHHPRPLLDALDRGFCSVEADIFLVDGQLLVGHVRKELRAGRTLQKLYLDPLQERVKKNGGRVFPNGPTVTLLVDIKTDGKKVYKVLRDILANYKEMLSSVVDGQYHERAVQVVISGDTPKQAIENDRSRYAGIDGRIADLDSLVPAHLMPLISDRWTSTFKWRGKGEFPQEEREKLQSIVKRAHSAGRRVRFWATPEIPALWRELRSAGVDHINTDQLDKLKDFLTE